MDKIKRKIIKIDEKKCNGCGLCIPNCPEGALRLIDGKVRLVSDLFCDGLGACIGHCPQDAITIEERHAEKYSERKVMKNIARQGKNVIKAHLEHLKAHNQSEYLQEAIDYLKEKKIEVPLFEKPLSPAHKHTSASSECPGSKVMDFGKKPAPGGESEHIPKNISPSLPGALGRSQLRQWPVQIMLVPPTASYLKAADLLIAADCVPFAYADFHQDLLKRKILLVGCPKLDDAEFYKEKLTQMIKQNNIKSITCAHMEVPCCSGLVHIIREALSKSGKKIPFKAVVIGIKGDMQEIKEK